MYFRFVSILFLAITACASNPRPFDIKHSFSANLLVFQESQRWQGEIQWSYANQNQGIARLSFPALGHIVELQWDDKNSWLRENQQYSRWHKVKQKHLVQLGLLLSPVEITRIITSGAPPNAAKEQSWMIHRMGKKNLEVTWDSQKKILTASEDRGARMVLKLHD